MALLRAGLWLILNIVILLIGIILISTSGREISLGEVFSQSVGASLIAASLCSTIMYLWTYINEKRLHGFDEWKQSGMQKFFEGRSVTIRKEYSRNMENFKSLDAMGFGMKKFLEDYKESFPIWSQEKNIRILLLDPDFPKNEENCSLSEIRSLEEGEELNQIRTDIESFVRFVQTNEKINKNNFQIRYYRVIPSINIFRIDEKMFFGPYLIEQVSRNTITFLCESKKPVYESLKQHFEKVWSSETYSRDALE